jgi:hypothetical protein
VVEEEVIDKPGVTPIAATSDDEVFMRMAIAEAAQGDLPYVQRNP